MEQVNICDEVLGKPVAYLGLLAAMESITAVSSKNRTVPYPLAYSAIFFVYKFIAASVGSIGDWNIYYFGDGDTLAISAECLEEASLHDLPEFVTLLSDKENDSATLGVESRRYMLDGGFDDRLECGV